MAFLPFLLFADTLGFNHHFAWNQEWQPEVLVPGIILHFSKLLRHHPGYFQKRLLMVLFFLFFFIVTGKSLYCSSECLKFKYF